MQQRYRQPHRSRRKRWNDRRQRLSGILLAQKHLRRHRDGNVDGDLVLSDGQQDPESALVGLG
ncbi:MAG TPA: hypothetical protein VIK30_14825 [Polyangia bacterium]